MIKKAEEYKFVRTPTLGKTHLTVLEALADSLRTSLSLDNLDLAKKRSEEILVILRDLIREESLALLPYDRIYRCTFRENQKVRCNKIPAMPIILNGKLYYRCKAHTIDKKGYGNESNYIVRLPSMCLTDFVYCWHCGKQFKKNQPKGIDTFENCPHCGKGFNDLSQEGQKAVLMTLKPFEGIDLETFVVNSK